MKYLALIMMFFSAHSFSENNLREQYSIILKSSCQIQSQDERDLLWGCIIEKTEQIDKFKATLDKLVNEIIVNKKGAVQIQSKELEEWRKYNVHLERLVAELYFPGADATTANFKIKQYIAKQKVELYLHMLLDIYEFDEISRI